MNPLARSLYRSRQFFGALRPSVDEGRVAAALAPLTAGERSLFESMTMRDQQHCLDVHDALLGQDRTERDLLAAALLHDCGKGHISVWHRVVFVLLDALSPRLLERLVRPGDGSGWQQALYRCKHHPELGAELARRAGSSELTIALIRGDATSARVREPLAALEAADDTV
jgi:HD domain